MPSGTKLELDEQRRIIAYDNASRPQAAISKELGRSRRVIWNFLKSPTEYRRTARPGRPPKLDSAPRRRLISEPKKGILSSYGLQQSLDLNVSASRVRQILKSNEGRLYKRMTRAPVILPSRIHKSFQWSSEEVTWTIRNWNRVVWTNEKKFNLDGPDGFAYYWHHLSREERIFSKR